MKPSERAFLKTVVSGVATGAALLSGGVLAPIATGVFAYNIKKTLETKSQENRNDEEGDVFVVYVDLSNLKGIGKIRQIIPDNPISDYLGKKSNTKIAHCYLEIRKDECYHLFEITPDLDGEILADKYGARALELVDIRDQTIDDFIYLMYKARPEGSMNCIEREFKGKTKWEIDFIREMAKEVFKSTNAYDLFFNNCQKFARELARQIL